VFAKSFARIHAQNLVNFGILPLTFEKPGDWEAIQPGDMLLLDNLRKTLQAGRKLQLQNTTRSQSYPLVHVLSGRQLRMVMAGGLINVIRQIQ
jgi:aconitate hydratase